MAVLMAIELAITPARLVAVASGIATRTSLHSGRLHNGLEWLSRWNMPESIKEMWDEFASGFDRCVPNYERKLVEQGFIAGAVAMFRLGVSGCMTPEVAEGIMQEIRTVSDGSTAKDGATHA
jgi:hypothetical protein